VPGAAYPKATIPSPHRPHERSIATVTHRHSRLGCLAAAAAVAGGLAGGADAATLPPRLASSHEIRFCSAVSLPPMEFMNAKTEPTGVDIALGDALAKRLGVKPVWINMPFAGLIPALLAGHCDAIMSQLFIKQSRLKVIDEIPYMYSHEAILMKAGAPKVGTLAGLAGKKAATVTGTTATILLRKANTELAAAKKPTINIVMFPENTQALQQLQFGQVAAYGVAYETARYYTHIAPGQFELGGPPYFKIATGIGLRKDETLLNTDLRAALAGLMKDGTYKAIFTTWNLQIDMQKP
jgi:polar amino acid transport system substrate-binding protein